MRRVCVRLFMLASCSTSQPALLSAIYPIIITDIYIKLHSKHTHTPTRNHFILHGPCVWAMKTNCILLLFFFCIFPFFTTYLGAYNALFLYFTAKNTRIQHTHELTPTLTH